MSDDNVYLNDVYQIGDAVQERRDHAALVGKLTLVTQRKVTKFLFQRPITGWYYGVLTEGVINVGMPLRLYQEMRMRCLSKRG